MMQMDLDLNTLMQKAYEIRRQFPIGSRVQLIRMDGKYLPIGSEGTVTGVDDIGTIHVRWDCGSSLGVVYPEDKCEIIY